MLVTQDVPYCNTPLPERLEVENAFGNDAIVTLRRWRLASPNDWIRKGRDWIKGRRSLLPLARRG